MPLQFSKTSQNTNLSVTDLQSAQFPSFRGISGQFFEQASTYINYAVPANSHITQTPQNKANMAKMQQIMRKVTTPQRCNQIGDSMARSQIQCSSVIDQTANNQTIIKDYALPIISELVKTDVEYFTQGLYGDPNYLENVQINNAIGAPVGLIAAENSIQRTNSQAFQRRSNVRSSSQNTRPAINSQKIPPNEQLVQKDILKGIDYVCQVVFKESYCLETQFFACSLFHRVASQIQLKKSELKLLAALCVFEATKHEENYGEALGASALVAYFGDVFTVKQLVAAEVRFLDAIEWRLGISSVNARVYLRTLFRDLGMDLKSTVMASFLAEISLLDQKFLQFTGFELALAAVELAVISGYVQPFDQSVKMPKSAVNQLFLITTSANSTSIRQFDNRNQKNKEQCRKMLSGQWIEITQRGQATQIYKKYCEDSYFKVALRTPIDDIDGAVQKIIAGM
ncbi:Cyclin-like_protein [Hexamita inflata]|uniref:Cyclin-like protein n=1 Tax=Hexamita inflata TaxID=28002 RepID=A0AA86TV64_9EUKA|nr:Cyclin-like protein [Hexamita inflata]